MKYCSNCNAERSDNAMFCNVCGQALTEKLFSEHNTETISESPKSNNKLMTLFFIAFIVAVIALVFVAFAFSGNKPDKFWKNYTQTHQVDSLASNISYTVTGQGGDASEFSYDIDTEKLISSQFYDIDGDGNDELLQIYIVKDSDNIRVYPSLEVVKEIDGEFSSERYNFKDTNYYISTIFDADYYLYKSDKDTYVIVEKDAPGESGQYCAASVISENHQDMFSYYFINYENGTTEFYDIRKDEQIFTINDTDYPFYRTQMANYRSLFFSLGLKGFLTGTDDIDKIANYSDITLIGKFEVNIDGENGSLVYGDLLGETD